MEKLEKALSDLKDEIEGLKGPVRESVVILDLMNLLNQLIPLVKALNDINGLSRAMHVLRLAKGIFEPVFDKRGENQSFLVHAKIEGESLTKDDLRSSFPALNKLFKETIALKNTHIYLVVNKASLAVLDFNDGVIDSGWLLPKEKSGKILEDLNKQYPAAENRYFTLDAKAVEKITKKLDYEENNWINSKQALPAAFPEIKANIQAVVNEFTKELKVDDFVNKIDSISGNRLDTAPDKVGKALLALLEIDVSDETTLALAQSVRKFATTMSENTAEIIDAFPGSSFYGPLATPGLQNLSKAIIEKLDNNIDDYSELRRENVHSSSVSVSSSSSFFKSKAPMAAGENIKPGQDPSQGPTNP